MQIYNISDYYFLLYALASGIGVSLVAGPVGSLLIWRKMSYFGDTLSHSTLLGVSLALIMGVNIYVGLIAICMLVAVCMGLFSRSKYIANDTILTLLSQLLLAIGLICITQFKSYRVDLLSYLYGDILSVTMTDLIWIYAIVFIVFALVFKYWLQMVNYCTMPDLAVVEGLPATRLKWGFLLVVSLVFAVAIKIVGVLLLTALVIIPAAAARFIASSPERMAIYGSMLGILSVISGLFISVLLDWPTGPTIVASSGAIFLGCFTISSLKNN